MNACCTGCGLLGRAESLERHDRSLPATRGERRRRTSARRAINVHGARAALSEPAAELGAVERQVVAQDVEQRRVRRGGNVVVGAVHADSQCRRWMGHEGSRSDSDVMTECCHTTRMPGVDKFCRGCQHGLACASACPARPSFDFPLPTHASARSFPRHRASTRRAAAEAGCEYRADALQPRRRGGPLRDRRQADLDATPKSATWRRRAPRSCSRSSRTPASP